MSMFTLAISYLTTSNLPWFMDLIFQLPIQYCSLQHWTLFPSQVTCTTGCCFCFGSVSIFSYENSKIITRCWTTVNRRMLDLTNIRYPMSKGKGEAPEAWWGGGGITFRIKHHTYQRCLECSNKPCVHQDPETPWRLSQNCVWMSPADGRVSSGLLQGQGLWVQ